ADPDRAAEDCPTLEFASLDGFYVTESVGCSVTASGRLQLVQDGPVAEWDGCFVEPQTSFAVGSVEVAYGAESDLPVSVGAYRKSDTDAVGLTRFGGELSLSVRTQEGVILSSMDVDFDPSWTIWRIELAGGLAVAKTGPDPAELLPVLMVPFQVDGEMGIVIGSWPGAGTGSERVASFDDMKICPP
ncbi:MAG TPA: hypothetical protein VFU21_26125, partial [Kofleriaceae bacterium]|nr:hypothetical protein [Kofleriaceae bacterium]